MAGNGVGFGRGTNAIQIDGLAAIQKSMKEAAPKIRREFNRDMRQIAGEVVGEVRGKMQEDYQATEAETGRKSRSTGEAVSSVRPSLQGGYIAVRAGGSGAPYYPWLDFGGDRRQKSAYTRSGRKGERAEHERQFRKDGRWIYPTIAKIRPRIYAKGMAAVEKWKRERGLS